MAFDEKYLDVLQNLEFAIVSVYRANNELLDHDVQSAIEALIDFYKAEEMGRQPRDFKLSEESIEVYESVKEMCEFRLGRVKKDLTEMEIELKPLQMKELSECLKTIKNSIIKWTKSGGRQGYLDFIKQFIP